MKGSERFKLTGEFGPLDRRQRKRRVYCRPARNKPVVIRLPSEAGISGHELDRHC